MGCETFIWQYDDLSGGCVANGDPAGEPSCGSEALQLWADAANAYSYWSSAFGRDGWDDAGGWLRLKVNHPPSFFGGLAQRKHVIDTSHVDFAQITIADGLASPLLDGHELGHALQFGTYTYTGLGGIHNQTTDVLEHHADVHGHRYQGLVLGAGYDCAGTDFNHYTQFRTANAGQGNKHIGNCHGWLMMRGGSPTTHYGVSVSPTTSAAYDQVTYRALDVYFTGGDDYFDWWNQLIVSAADLYGVWSDAHQSAVAARDAIGGWSGLQSLPVGVTGVHTNDRFAAVGWDGAPRGPCVFYRYSGSTTRIYWSCRDVNGWSPAAPFNDVGVDPAASEPTAVYRYESGHFIYVLWRGTDDRIHYRRFDPQTLTIGPPLDLGGSANRLTSGPVAAASIYETPSVDRLVIVYHPKAQPTWYYATHLGSSTVTDLGPSVDATADPTLVAFPYYEWDAGTNRVYFVRSDASWSATPGHLRYLSYSLAGGWSFTPQSITDLFSGEPGMLSDVVRTDRGVALAEYNRTPGTTRLRMAFVTTGEETSGQRELWYATLRQTMPGTLERDPGYRAVPLAPVGSGTHQSAGGLALGTGRSPLYHFWGDSGPVGKLASWQTFSD